MSQVAFDTLKFTETLKQAGVSEQHAKAEAIAIQGAFSEALNTQVATKADIQKLKDDVQAFKEEIKDDMQAFKDEVKKDTQGLKDDVTKLGARMDNLDTGLTARIDTVDTELTARIDAVDTKLTAKINLVHWMVGFNLAFTLAMFWKLFSQ